MKKEFAWKILYADRRMWAAIVLELKRKQKKIYIHTYMQHHAISCALHFLGCPAEVTENKNANFFRNKKY